MHYRRILAVTLLTVACQSGERAATSSVPAVDSATRARAVAAADALGKDLIGMLTAELQRGGPAAAISVCADSAQIRTARHQLDGVDVRRVGTRVRNPANAPDSIEQAVLAAFASPRPNDTPLADTTFVVMGASGVPSLRYMRAIRVQPQCLACHGAPAEMDTSVRALIAARYPDDQATGYAAGDLRGAISVRLRQE